MFVDSHCHLDFPELVVQLPEVLKKMQDNRVSHALCVSVNLPDWPGLIAIVERNTSLWASVGVHPDYEDTVEPDIQFLVEKSRHPKVVAIGETGLDYFRLKGDLTWQRDRFRTHIRAARQARLPLIIHTRASSEDTIALMREECAGSQAGSCTALQSPGKSLAKPWIWGFISPFRGSSPSRAQRTYRTLLNGCPWIAS